MVRCSLCLDWTARVHHRGRKAFLVRRCVLDGMLLSRDIPKVRLAGGLSGLVYSILNSDQHLRSKALSR